MTKQITGTFPVFGSDADLGNLQNTNQKVIMKNTYPSFYTGDTVNYMKGFTDTPNYKQLNGIFNHITSGLNYIYKNGIPPFTLDVAYPRGAVVTFNGSVFVSKSDNNTNHVSQKTFWDKLVTESTQRSNDDGLPIGTILTVPITSSKQGYIDYVEGDSFNPTIYPELYTALGQKTFGTYSHNGIDVSLPIGSMVHWLSGNTNVPDGWIEWKTDYGLLNKYPELYAVLSNMVERMELTSTKEQWRQALRTYSLPMFEMSGFYLGLGSVGQYEPDKTKQYVLNSAPVVIDNSNTLNPLGVTRCAAEKESYPVVVNPQQNVTRSFNDTSYVVVGQPANVYQASVDKRSYETVVGDADVTAPKTLFTRLLIKATNPRPSAISSTHKQLIKAFTVKD